MEIGPWEGRARREKAGGAGRWAALFARTRLPKVTLVGNAERASGIRRAGLIHVQVAFPHTTVQGDLERKQL